MISALGRCEKGMRFMKSNDTLGQEKVYVVSFQVVVQNGQTVLIPSLLLRCRLTLGMR